MALDYNWIMPNIAQGAYPKKMDEAFAIADFVLFCAEEMPPPRARPPAGKVVVRLPLDDDFYRPLPHDVGNLLHQQAKTLASHLRSGGRKALITCAMGRNRSGLMTALTMIHLYKMDPAQAIATIKARRKDTLTNPMFEQYLLAYGRPR